GVYSVASAAIELAEAEVAVGDEGAHAEFIGNGTRLVVAIPGLLDIRSVRVGVNLPEEAERPRLLPALTPLPGECERSLGQRFRLLCPIGKQVALSERAHRAASTGKKVVPILHRLFEQRQRLSQPAGPSIG